MGIVFDKENHKYFWNNEELIPVSDYIRKKYLILLKKPSDEEALKFGSRIHEEIENYFKNGSEVSLSSFNNFVKAVRDFVNCSPITEQIVYDLNEKIAGTYDFFCPKNGTLIDWKTTYKSRKTLVEEYKKLIDYFNEGKFEPLNHYLFSYILQQRLYAKMMKNFGYNVKRKLLVFLNKNNDEFTTISINKIEEKLDGNVEEEGRLAEKE